MSFVAQIFNFVLHCRQAPNVHRLPITLYYEALCPFCMEFVTKQLDPSMVHAGRLAYAELTLVPYGNARVGCQYVFIRTHLNIVYAVDQ